MLTEIMRLECPYCGEPFETDVDYSAGSQSYYEDCPVCCRPMELIVDVNHSGELAGVQVRRDDD